MTYDNSMIDGFPEEFSMELPDDYRIDTEYDDDWNQVALLRGGIGYDDEGDETFEFTGSFMTINTEVQDRDDLIKQGKLKNHFVPGLVLEEIAQPVQENLEEQFGPGKRLNLYNSFPASIVMKYYKPINIFGVTLEAYIVLFLVEINESITYGINTVYQNDPSGNEEFFRHLLNVIKAVRVNGQPVDIGKLTPQKLERALDMEIDEDVEALDLGVSIGINFKAGDEETNYTLNSDGSITKEKVNTALEYTSPDESLYPHYNSKLSVQGFGLLGLNVVVNQTGTEYKFYQLSEILDNEDASEEFKEAISQLEDKGAAKYKLADRSVEMRSVFHVSPAVFDSQHDKECELAEDMMQRAYMMSALRSFAWTLSKYCDELDIKPKKLPLEQIQKIIDFASDQNWLNYDGKSYCKSLCGTSDLHVYYLPDKTPKSVKALFGPSKEILEQTRKMKEQFPSYNPILEEIGSLDGLRKDLEYIYPAIEKIYTDVKKNRDCNEPLTGNDGDILYAWCALAYAARGPFFSEDGPMNCWFSQILSEEEQIKEQEERRAKTRKAWMKSHGDSLEKNPDITFEGKRFVLRCTDFRISEDYSESYYRNLIEDKGGLVRSKVSGITDYLIVDPGTDAYIDDALEKQKAGKPVKIILVDDLRNALGLQVNESVQTSAPSTVASGTTEQKKSYESKNTSTSVETVIVDDTWAIEVPEGYKYCTDKSIIGGHRNIIIMEDKGDNDFEDPFNASVSFTSMFTECENAPAVAKMKSSFMGNNVTVLKDEADLYVSYYYDSGRSYKNGDEKLDIFQIDVGCGKGASSIQVFFNESELSRRAQQKIVADVAKSIRLRKPGEQNSISKTPVKDNTAKGTLPPSRGSSPSAQPQRNMVMWGFQKEEVPANRKKLIENIKGYKIRFLPYSAVITSGDSDMEKFKYYCSMHRTDHVDKIKSLVSHADQYAELFNESNTADDLKNGKLLNSAPIHALRSFIWTAVEHQDKKLRNSFLSDAPEEMWLDLASFIGLSGYANYSAVNKNVKRFGAALLRKEEIRSIYSDVIAHGSYKDEKLEKTMANASLNSLFQVVDSLYDIMPVMDLYYDQIMKSPDSTDSEYQKMIIMGWMVYAYACRQPFFIVPGEYFQEEIDYSSLQNWNESPVITDMEDGKYTVSGTQLIRINKIDLKNDGVLELPEGITGILVNDDTRPGLISAFARTRKLIYPRSVTKTVVIPPEVKEIEVKGDFDTVMVERLVADVAPKLERLDFKGSVRRLTKRCLAGLFNLRYLSFAEGLERIEEEGLTNCSFKMKELYLPESLSEIHRTVFAYYAPDRINVYRTCPVLNEIRRQVREYEQFAVKFNRDNANGNNNRDFEYAKEYWTNYYQHRTERIVINVMESPWAVRADSFAKEIDSLYKESATITTETVRRALDDTIGEEYFEKCKAPIVTEALARSQYGLVDLIKNTDDDHELYCSLPKKLAEDINHQIEAKIQAEREQRRIEIESLSRSDKINDVSKAVLMIEQHKGEIEDADEKIRRCQIRIDEIVKKEYSDALTIENDTKASRESEKITPEQAIQNFNKAINIYKEIEGHKDVAKDIEHCKVAIQDMEKRIIYDSATIVPPKTVQDYTNAIQNLQSISGYLDADAIRGRYQENLNNHFYQRGLESAKERTADSLRSAMVSFKSAGNYKDAAALVEKCEKLSNLMNQRNQLTEQLPQLAGFFKRKQRKAVEAQIAAIEAEMATIEF